MFFVSQMKHCATIQEPVYKDRDAGSVCSQNAVCYRIQAVIGMGHDTTVFFYPQRFPAIIDTYIIILHFPPYLPE